MKQLGMGRRTKIITEYRQTGGDADGDKMVGMRWGWVQNILPCHLLLPSATLAILQHNIDSTFFSRIQSRTNSCWAPVWFVEFILPFQLSVASDAVVPDHLRMTDAAMHFRRQMFHEAAHRRYVLHLNTHKRSHVHNTDLFLFTAKQLTGSVIRYCRAGWEAHLATHFPTSTVLQLWPMSGDRGPGNQRSAPYNVGCICLGEDSPVFYLRCQC